MSNKKSTMNLELIGGIYLVEKFPDGTERREEIDGQPVLELIVLALEEHIIRLGKKK